MLTMAAQSGALSCQAVDSVTRKAKVFALLEDNDVVGTLILNSI
jgi:hypothetical protein